jgi:hypothetical protein
MRGCYVEYADGRSVEIKDGSARTLLQNNTFVCVGGESWRPSISTGESVFAIHFHDNEWHYKTAPHPNTPMIFRMQQYGGSFKRNHVHTDEGVSFPDHIPVMNMDAGSRHKRTEMDPKADLYTHLNPDHESFRMTGFFVCEDNRYEVATGSAYKITGAGRNDEHQMKQILIRNEDWTGSTFSGTAGGMILNSFPAHENEVVIVENVKHMTGGRFSWQSEDPASCFPRLYGDYRDPEQLNSVSTKADLTRNPLVNDTLIRRDGVVVKTDEGSYVWSQAKGKWKDIDGGEDIYPNLD